VTTAHERGDEPAASQGRDPETGNGRGAGVSRLLRALARRLPSWLKLAAFENFQVYLPRVLHYARPYWPLALASVGVVLGTAVVGLATPWPLKILVDSALGSAPLPPPLANLLGGLAQNRVGLIVFVVAAEIAIAGVLQVLTVATNFTNNKLDLSMTLDFRTALFRHTQRLSLAFHDRRKSGMALYRINYMDEAPTRFLMSLFPLIQNVVTLVGMFFISVLIHRNLALLSLVVVPFLYYSVGYYSTRIKGRIMQVRQQEGETLSIIHEALAMLRVVAAFGREDHEHQRLRDQGARANAVRLNLTVRQSLFASAVAMTTATGTALVLGYGAYEVLEGRLTIGQLLVVLSYIGSVYSPLESLSATVADLQEQLVDLHIAFQLLDTEPQIVDPPGATVLPPVEGRVTFECVDFAYEGRERTLAGISFEVPAGQALAIVGPTGAGKTTLASLMPRFYDPTAGRILIDGRDIRSVTVASLRRQISIVLQETMLFSTSVEENIRYGRLEATQQEIEAAAVAANAHEFIMALPQKYATNVGERGARLSGGERQRIGVARAFLKNAPILILDEPTSSIDSQTEEGILDALEHLMVGRTTFMIAHRLSTLRHVDRIVVLHHGEQVEQGTHEELMQNDGLYKQLHDLQSGQVRRRVRDALRPLKPKR